MNTKHFLKKIVPVLVTGILLAASVLPASAFNDIGDIHPYKADIEYIQSLSVLNPTLENFEPDSPITRKEFAKWVLKSAGFGDESYRSKVKKVLMDVPFTNPYAPFIYKLRDLGALDGSQKSYLFYPEKNLNRQEALNWIFFVHGIPTPKIFDESKFVMTDIKATSQLAPMVFKAHQLGMFGTDTKAGLKKILTRGQAARFLRLAKDGNNITIQFTPGSNTAISQNPKFDVLSSVFNQVNRDYLRKDELKQDDLIYGAAEGLVKELGDKHSNFERPGESTLVDSLSGQVEGIGAIINSVEEEIVVVTPVVGGPAEKAGILAGDVILKVNDKEVTGMKSQDAANLIKGKKGTQVTLLIRRGTAQLTYTITRDVVKILSTSLKFTPDNIAIVQITDFGAKTASEFNTIAKTILDKNAKGIVLDLRNNPGGYLDTSISIAGHFIAKGKPVSVVKYPNFEQVQNSNGLAELGSIKTVVIINGGSASASEILAGSLQDYGLAKVVGEKSYGKGTVQELITLTDGSTLRLTIANWLTPNRRLIEGVGIPPDAEVKLTDEDRKNGKDPQLDRALLELR